MKLSFVIVNYKSRNYLDNCLFSIAENVKEIDFEIIIVNSDEEKIFELKTENLKEKIKIIELNENIGFGRANNLGVKKCGGDILCLLNPDTEIISKDIKNILKIFEEQKEISVIGPKIVEKNFDGQYAVQKWNQGMDLNIVELLRSKLGIPRSRKIWQSKIQMEIDWVSGACMFFRKNDFLEIGGFDEKIFLYYEDVDICKRINLAGKKVLYDPDFQVLHWGGKSEGEIAKRKKEYFLSQDYYYQKWFSKLSQYLLKFLRFFYAWRYKI